jgi:hypothetical protein
MQAMEHSIAAKYAARPAARFPRSSIGNGRPRLGLTPLGAFRAASDRQTVLRASRLSPFAQLRRDSRSIAATRPIRHSTGRPRPPVSLTWVRSVSVRRPSAPVAPWRA